MREDLSNTDDFAITQEAAQIFIDTKSDNPGTVGTPQRRKEMSLTIHVDEDDGYESD